MLIADELTSNALRHGAAPGRDGPEPPGPPVAGRGQRLLHRCAPGARRRAATPGSAASASTSSPTSSATTAGPASAARSRSGPSSRPTTPSDSALPRASDSRVTSVTMSLVDQLDTVTDASAGTVDRHATTADLRVDEPGLRRRRRRLPGARRRRRPRDRRARPARRRAVGRPRLRRPQGSGWPPGAATSPAG